MNDSAAWWNMVLPWLLVAIPILLLLAVFTTGVALVLSAANVYFHDVNYLWGITSQILLLGLMTAVGTMFVWYFSKDLKALDTMDFWVGTVMLFVQATILVMTCAFVLVNFLVDLLYAWVDPRLRVA